MTARMVAFLAIDGAFAILGPTWPASKSKFPRRLSASFVRTASDFRWWVIALLFGLIGPALIGHSRHRPLLIPDDRELPEAYPARKCSVPCLRMRSKPDTAWGLP